MTNWYAVQKKSDGSVVSYVSDDVKNYNVLDASLQLSAPFATQKAVQDAMQPQAQTAQQINIATLQAKPASAWTLVDVATWLQSKG